VFLEQSVKHARERDSLSHALQTHEVPMGSAARSEIMSTVAYGCFTTHAYVATGRSVHLTNQ
jgi:hypothetical protein